MRSAKPPDGTRRTLLKGSVAAGALALSPLGRLLANAGAPLRHAAGYGPLQPVRDRSTGLPLLWLPRGFEYTSFGWSGEPMADGTPTPGAHDGMGIVRSEGAIVTLVRNHELVSAHGGFGPLSARYDRDCDGGTVTLRFDTEAGALLEARPSLSGTLQNCSGGVTPWGSWLSCEEFVCAEGLEVRRNMRLQRAHGFVFEVPADGLSDARALTGLGQFRHEAAVVHARSGAVYLTEDLSPVAGFYRFVPARAGQLAGGGALQMLQAVGHPDLRRGVRTGRPMAVRWVDIDEPARGIGPDGDARGVQLQGLQRGASRFTRLEGCFASEEEIFFTSTDGGDAACGQVFVYHVARQELRLLFESPSPGVLDYPDNVCLSPRGGLLLCQDSKGPVQHLHGLSADGALFSFARNDVVLDGSEGRGAAGNYRGAEWAGACFSADGRWLFANIYRPGFSVAITGPWGSGLL